MINIIKKRILPVVVCCAIILSAFAYRPQKVEAVALSTTAVVASVAAIMTACGVSYWANTQQDAISYLAGQIDDYLDTLSNTEMTYDEWLGISYNTSLFTVIGNGILSFGSSVANKILEFVRWFNQEESVVSNGQPVGQLGQNISFQNGHYGFDGTYSSSVNGSLLSVAMDGYLYEDSMVYVGSISSLSSFSFPLSVTVAGWDDDGQVTSSIFFLSADQGGYYYLLDNLHYYDNGTHNITISAIPSDAAYIGFGSAGYSTNSDWDYTGTTTFSFSAGLSTPSTAVVTPSASVSVPNAIAVGQTLDVTTNANITQGASVEDASSAILGTVADAGGLSSTNDVAGEAVPSESVWLWDTITSLPETIAQKIGALFVPDSAFAESYVQELYNVFDNRFSILSYPFSLLGEFSTRLLTLGNPQPIFKWNDLKDPFSGKKVISAGQYNLNDALTNQRISDLYDLYMLLVKAIISFQFVNFLYAWFCDVFKMKESDYPLPWDSADGDDDAPDDGDGYDGTWSSW